MYTSDKMLLELKKAIQFLNKKKILDLADFYQPSLMNNKYNIQTVIDEI